MQNQPASGTGAEDLDRPRIRRTSDLRDRLTSARQAILLRIFRWSEGSEREIVVSTPKLAAKTNMDENLLPSVAFDEAEMYKSLGKLRDLRDKQGATIIYGHDPDQWKEIPHAPEPLA